MGKVTKTLSLLRLINEGDDLLNHIQLWLQNKNDPISVHHRKKKKKKEKKCYKWQKSLCKMFEFQVSWEKKVIRKFSFSVRLIISLKSLEAYVSLECLHHMEFHWMHVRVKFADHQRHPKKIKNKSKHQTQKEKPIMMLIKKCCGSSWKSSSIKRQVSELLTALITQVLFTLCVALEDMSAHDVFAVCFHSFIHINSVHEMSKLCANNDWAWWEGEREGETRDTNICQLEWFHRNFTSGFVSYLTA